MSKKVLFKSEARKKLQIGVDIIANAVRQTMGPKGRSVIIPKGSPVFTLDGVTVAQSINELKDPVENMGADLVKNVAQITNDEAGDGTTTATVLVQALLREGLKGVENGLDPIIMREAMNKGVSLVLEKLAVDSKEVKNVDQMKAVATISSRDEEIGEIISKIYDKVGKDGVITTEEVNMVGMDYEIVKGMQIDSGYMLPHFITDIEKRRAVLEKPYILVTSETVRTNEEILPIISDVIGSEAKSLVILVDDCQGEALASAVINKMKGMLSIVVVKTPGYGDNKVEYIQDICAITGADHLSEQTSTSIETVKIEDLGEADRVIVEKDKMVIIGGKGNTKEINARMKSIEKELEEAEGTYKKQNLTQRLARLKGGVAIIKVGDVTEEASREKQYRIEDAINATKSAMEEGIVVGGGMALYEASKVLDKEIANSKSNDYRFGLQIVQNAIRRPALQILENQNKNAEVVISEGYELSDDVIDPLKVERVALEQSASVVGLFLVTGAVVYEEPKEDDKKN